jgi:hypothetical protein
MRDLRRSTSANATSSRALRMRKAESSTRFNSVSTSSQHLIETGATENRAFLREAGIRLGRRGAGVQIAHPHQWS